MQLNLIPDYYENLFIRVYKKNSVQRVELIMNPQVTFIRLVRILGKFFCNS